MDLTSPSSPLKSGHIFAETGPEIEDLIQLRQPRMSPEIKQPQLEHSMAQIASFSVESLKASGAVPNIESVQAL